MRILLIEDDPQTAITLQLALKEHYIVEIAKTAEEGEYKAQINDYSAILIDYLLPDGDGINLCKALRTDGIRVPILMITGNDEMGNKLQAFHQGIDDYLVKPINEDELHARIQAIWRRTATKTSADKLICADLIVDPIKREAQRGNKKLQLKRKEFDILEYLMRNRGKAITRSMIFDNVWESDYESDSNVIDVHIKYLRSQVDQGFEKKLIKTVHGIGYKIDL